MTSDAHCPKCRRPRLDTHATHVESISIARVDVCLLEGATLCAVAAHAFEKGMAAGRARGSEGLVSPPLIEGVNTTVIPTPE